MNAAPCRMIFRIKPSRTWGEIQNSGMTDTWMAPQEQQEIALNMRHAVTVNTSRTLQIYIYIYVCMI